MANVCGSARALLKKINENMSKVNTDVVGKIDNSAVCNNDDTRAEVLNEANTLYNNIMSDLTKILADMDDMDAYCLWLD